MKHLIAQIAWLALLLLPGCRSSGAGLAPGAQLLPDEEREILIAIDGFFEAMAKRDVAAYSSYVLPEGMTFTQVLKDGHWELRSNSQRELAESLGRGRGVPNETYWQPTVLIRGPLAVVWAPYRFALDGQEQHRGVDVFDMLKVEGRWLIANTIWTREPGGDLVPPAGEQVRPAALR